MSFKQQDSLRYSARDIAIFRAKQANVPVILGSATPSLESYYNAMSRPLPQVAPAIPGGKNADAAGHPLYRYPYCQN